MLANWLRTKTESSVTAICRLLLWTGLTPNAITVIGTLMMFAIAAIISQGYLFLGGFLIIVAGLFDALDGSMARLTNTVSTFGAFLDSTTDRYAEAALFFGILNYLVNVRFYDPFISATVIYFVLFGSIMVSYCRARAEGLSIQCKDGLFSRFERIAVLVIGLLLTRFFGVRH
jgi:CDP-diacylglycerol--glycerol-3-phosphate 3-phosphatidyltransferase